MGRARSTTGMENGAVSLFRKRVPRKAIGRYRAAPTRPEPSIDRLVHDARLLAHAGVRMAVKNSLIVDAAGRRVDFDLAALRTVARESLVQLAEQQRVIAESEDRSEADYRRVLVLRGLVSALIADAADEKVVEDIVAASRDAAWAEVSASIMRNARNAVEGHRRDPDHENGRDERLAAFIAMDLTGLAHDRGFLLDQGR